MVKSKCVFVVFAIFVLFLLISFHHYAYAKTDGAAAGNTGSPGDGQSCAQTGCHTGTAVTRDSLISINVPADGYLAIDTYSVIVSIIDTGTVKFGFEASPQDSIGNILGEMILTNATETKFVGGGDYITHTSSGTDGVNSKTWTFNWTPVSATGDVTFYVAVNASNNMDNASGDSIYLSSVTIHEHPDNLPITIEEIEHDFLFDIMNPVVGYLEINVATQLTEPLIIEIIDTNGKLTQTNLINSTQHIRLPIENLEAGIYFVRLSQANTHSTKKFIKM